MLRYHCEVFTIYGCCFMKIFVNALSTPPIGGSAGEWVKDGKSAHVNVALRAKLKTHASEKHVSKISEL